MSFFDTSIGVILIGLMVTGCTYGVTGAQAVWYLMHYPKDRRFLRYMVYVVCGLDTLSLLLYSAATWQSLVRRDVQETVLPWTSDAQIVCNALTIAIIQSFYGFRIWILSKHKLLVGTLGIFVLGDLALGLLLFAKSVQAKSLDELATLTAYDIAMSTMTAATDVLLCTALVVLLSSSKARTSNAGSNRMIRKLLFYTIETGSLTSICSILSLITVIVFPTQAFYVMFYYIGSRMYSASLLSMLNAREGLRHESEQHYTMETMPQLTSGLHSAPGDEDLEGRKGTGSAPSREIVVSIHRDTTVTFEEGDQKAKDVYRKAFRYKKPKMPAAAAAKEDTSSVRSVKLADDALP